MKHNLRINGEVKEIDCDIATGLRDKNGKKYFVEIRGKHLIEYAFYRSELI